MFATTMPVGPPCNYTGFVETPGAFLFNKNRFFLVHRTVVVTPTLFPGTFPPWNCAHPGRKKVTPKTLHHGTPLKTAKCSKHQKLGTYKTQWNTSHTHLERGTCFIILQMGLHDRTAWNAAFTTLNMSCSNLALFPFLQIIMTGPMQPPPANNPYKIVYLYLRRHAWYRVANAYSEWIRVCMPKARLSVPT